MSNIVLAVDALAAITTLVVRGAQAQQYISQLIQQAQSEGRDLTEAEVQAIHDRRQAAMDRWNSLA